MVHQISSFFKAPTVAFIWQENNYLVEIDKQRILLKY